MVSILWYVNPNAISRLESDGNAFQVLQWSVKSPGQSSGGFDQSSSWRTCALLAHDTPHTSFGADGAGFTGVRADAKGP